MSSLILKNIEKSFGTQTVIKSLDLSIDAGEFMVLVGPSGCGKSTLLRLIAGLEQPSAGRIELDNALVNHLPPKQRGIAMVFQNYALYPHMSVEKNIEFSLKLAGVKKHDVKKRVKDAAQLLKISDHLGKKPHQLSGGQKQRVAIGRAMVRQPKLFLFDEPLSNLDAQLRIDMRAEIAHLHRKLKTTSIYVTHDQVEAMTLADRIAVFNQGRIEQLGTPMEIYAKPVNRFVAGFMGSSPMNFIDHKALRSAGVPPDSREVGFRPDAALLTSVADATEGQLSLGSGCVKLVEPLGSHVHVHMEVPGFGTIICEAPTSQRPAIESQHYVHLQQSELYFFDDNGRAIVS